MTHPSRRFWLELGLAVFSAVLVLLTLVTRKWIELVFHVDPDRGNGSFEWLLVAAATVATATFAQIARLDWRRTREATR
jgi:hypothetical protein